MLPPIDLNLMKINEHGDTRMLLAKSEAAQLLKLTNTNTDVLALCQHFFRPIWVSLKKRTAAGTVSSTY